MARGQGRTGGRGAKVLAPRDIVVEALRICDAYGLDALTVRRLANELGVGTMTLYRYFRSKEEILDAIADHVLGGMVVPPADPEDPAAVLRTVGHAFRDLMQAHPSLVQLVGTQVTTSQHSLKGGMEAVLSRLVAAGLSDELAVRCYGFLITYALGFAHYQHPRRWGRGDGREAIELRHQRGHFYASMPAGEFPTVVALSERLVGLPSDEQFESASRCSWPA
jgi:AcrR family transcriptional regulator